MNKYGSRHTDIIVIEDAAGIYMYIYIYVYVYIYIYIYLYA